MKKHKMGKLTRNGVILSAHEQTTVDYLLKCGYDVDLITSVKTKQVKNPDLILNHSQIWEMKRPTKARRITLERLFKRALHQSHSVIFDLRGLPEKFVPIAANTLKSLFSTSKSARKLLIIIDDNKLPLVF